MKHLQILANLRTALNRFLRKHIVRRSYYDILGMDLMIYGNCFEKTFKPNLFHKIFRPMFGLPINKKRIDPRKVRLMR